MTPRSFFCNFEMAKCYLPVPPFLFAELFHFAKQSLFWLEIPQVRGFGHWESKLAL